MSVGIPAWAIVTPKRREHIARVVTLLGTWAEQLQVSAAESTAWRDAGHWHDAFRDADESVLRAMTGDHERPVGMLHGPAAAMRLRSDGETRADVLDAIHWHTVGHLAWSRTGRALYMADFLEPGRPFMQADRAFLAARVADAFDEVFRQVVRLRLEWAIRERKGLEPETIQMWNAVR